MPPSRRRTVLVGLAALLALALPTACGGRTGAGSAPTTAATSAKGAVTVLAAASLTEAFTQIGRDFEAKNPGEQITFSFGSSATLATQITQGAPADVFAAASAATMKNVTDADAARSATNFAANTLEIAVPLGNPARIEGLSDFADVSKKIALCAPEVPCGAAAVKVFAAAGITAKPDTLEQDVKAALQKVSSDEVDAALVYRTDVIAASGRVEGITFPQADAVVNEYPIAVLSGAQNAAGAQAFVDYVLSADGGAVLAEAGFAQP